MNGIVAIYPQWEYKYTQKKFDGTTGRRIPLDWRVYLVGYARLFDVFWRCQNNMPFIMFFAEY